MMIEAIVVEQGVEVTRKALGRLGRSGIPVVLLDGAGRVQSRVVPGWYHDPTARLSMAAACLDQERALSMARRWVEAKIRNQAAVLRASLRNHPNPQMAEARNTLLESASRVSGAATRDELMGMEGYAARVYFGVFRHLLRPEWIEFNGRNRRPPLDPVNAALSYAYAILYARLVSLCEVTGLDPYHGFLHPPQKFRASLALDLLEPLRPALADRLVLSMFNRKMLREEHFGAERHPAPGIFLNKEGRMVFAEHTAKWLPGCDEFLPGFSSPTGVVTREVDALRKAAADGKPESFQPYRIEQEDA
jgi:CRISPR-associated protein Cas1